MGTTFGLAIRLTRIWSLGDKPPRLLWMMWILHPLDALLRALSAVLKSTYLVARYKSERSRSKNRETSSINESQDRKRRTGLRPESPSRVSTSFSSSWEI